MSQDRKEMINRKGEKEVLLRKRKGEVEYLSFRESRRQGLSIICSPPEKVVSAKGFLHP